MLNHDTTNLLSTNDPSHCSEGNEIVTGNIPFAALLISHME